VSAVPVDDGYRVGEASRHRDVLDVCRPHLT
jgi:hypothetical protein